MINLVKGTHDIIMDEAPKYTLVEEILKGVASAYGYNEFRTPIIEHTELFLRSVGDSSDIVRKEMYVFNDKGGRSLALRPEITAGTIRTMVNNKLFANQDFPVKAFYLGPCFRYERPSSGRYRQFNQFGVECVGVNNPYRDAEVILLGVACLKALHLTNIKLKINTLGDDASRKSYIVALKNYFSHYLDDMCSDCHERYNLNVLRILDCKVEKDQEIIKNAPKISDYLTTEAKESFNTILKILDDNNIDYEIDNNLVRGLDYYSGVVFEFHYSDPTNKNYGALGGGGHYDKLVAECGGPQIEGIGFSFGIERLVGVLDEFNCFENIKNLLDIYIMPIGEKNIPFSLKLAEKLRISGLLVDICVENKNFSQMFKKAERRKAKFALIIGDEEIQQNIVKFKNLLTQEQFSVSLDNLDEKLEELFLEGKDHCHCDGECECHYKE